MCVGFLIYVIEREKWHIIWTSLKRVESRFVTRPENVSEASWAEAHLRAAAFLAAVKLKTEKPATSKPKKVGR